VQKREQKNLLLKEQQTKLQPKNQETLKISLCWKKRQLREKRKNKQNRELKPEKQTT
jgi:hypothetical protein